MCNMNGNWCISDLWCDSCVVVHHSNGSFLCTQLQKRLEHTVILSFSRIKNHLQYNASLLFSCLEKVNINQLNLNSDYKTAFVSSSLKVLDDGIELCCSLPGFSPLASVYWWPFQRAGPEQWLQSLTLHWEASWCGELWREGIHPDAVSYCHCR